MKILGSFFITATLVALSACGGRGSSVETRAELSPFLRGLLVDTESVDGRWIGYTLPGYHSSVLLISSKDGSEQHKTLTFLESTDVHPFKSEESVIARFDHGVLEAIDPKTQELLAIRRRAVIVRWEADLFYLPFGDAKKIENSEQLEQVIADSTMRYRLETPNNSFKPKPLLGSV